MCDSLMTGVPVGPERDAFYVRIVSTPASRRSASARNEVAHIYAERRHGFVEVYEVAEVLPLASWRRRTLPSE